MKMLRYKILFFVGFLLSALWVHAATQDKTINKSFKVKPSTKIEIDNKFGKVHVNTWDQNEVKVLVEIEVNDSKNVDELLNSIHIDFDHEPGENHLKMKTSYDDIRRKASYSVNYTLSVPRSNPLAISNKFGDVYISDLNGDLDLDLGYGQLKAEQLNGNVELDMEFGSGMSQIAFIKKGKIEIKYTKLTIDKAGPLEIEAQFSEIFSADLSSVNVEMKYGKLISSEIGSVIGGLSFSDFETELLKGNFDLQCKHNHVQIDRVGENVNDIRFEGKFSKMDIGLSDANHFKFDFELKFGDLKQRGIQLMFEYAEIDKTDKTYRGVIGKKEKAGNFEFNSEYGDLVLHYD